MPFSSLAPDYRPPGNRGKRTCAVASMSEIQPPRPARTPAYNAFRHQRVQHRVRGADPDDEFDVLNAFRHQRVQHVFEHENISECSMCSTPFGIRGFNIRSRTSARQTLFSAQRLSASEGSTSRVDCWTGRSGCSAQRLSASEGSTSLFTFLLYRPFKCSTPFGIRGFNIADCAAAGTSRGSAQRLSASEGSTYDDGQFGGDEESFGAQRLSASEGSTFWGRVG